MAEIDAVIERLDEREKRIIRQLARQALDKRPFDIVQRNAPSIKAVSQLLDLGLVWPFQDSPSFFKWPSPALTDLGTEVARALLLKSKEQNDE